MRKGRRIFKMFDVFDCFFGFSNVGVVHSLDVVTYISI